LGENIDTIQKNTDALLDAGKEVGLEVNSKKTKYRHPSLSAVKWFQKNRALSETALT
jgi:hypothetical protein